MPSKGKKNKKKQQHFSNKSNTVAAADEDEDLDALLKDFAVKDATELNIKRKKTTPVKPTTNIPLETNADVIIYGLTSETTTANSSNVELVLQPDQLNGLGARTIDKKKDKDGISIYTSRLHYTGLLLELPETNLYREKLSIPKPTAAGRNKESTAAEPSIHPKISLPVYRAGGGTKKKIYAADHGEMYDAVIGYARQHINIRKELTLRVKQGMQNNGGRKGCLVVHLYKTNSAEPVMVRDAEEALSPSQTVFVTLEQMQELYGYCWTNGRAKSRFDVGPPYPQSVERTAVFLNDFPLEWDEESMAIPGSTPAQIKQQRKDFLKFHGLTDLQANAAHERHVRRRRNGETPPMLPNDKEEHLYATVLYMSGLYDEHISKPHNLTPLGDNIPLWLESFHAKDEFGTYDTSFATNVFCFVPVPRQSEKAINNAEVTYANGSKCVRNRFKFAPKREDVVDGWFMVGFSTFQLWSEKIQREFDKEDVQHGKEAKDFWLKTDVKGFNPDIITSPANVSASAQLYEGGRFKSNLASSRKMTIRSCNNPMCTKKHVKSKSVGGGANDHVKAQEGSTLFKCSRCIAVYYCSKACQRADWKAHKLVCKRRYAES